jgi:hypothetical protein
MTPAFHPPPSRRLPFGHEEHIIPIEVPSGFGQNSPRRKALIKNALVATRGQHLSVYTVDDPDPATLDGGHVQLHVTGLPSHIADARRVLLTILATVSFEGLDGRPKPFNLLDR